MTLGWTAGVIGVASGMVTMTWNPSELGNRLAAIDRATTQGRATFLCAAGAIVAKRCAMLATERAKDTGRYRRAWQLAANRCLELEPSASAAAGPPAAVGALSESKFAKWHFVRINRNQEYFIKAKRRVSADLEYELNRVGMIETYERKGRNGTVRTGTRVAKLNKPKVDRLRKALWKIDLALERLDAQERKLGSVVWKYAIVLGGKKTKDPFALSRAERVFTELYGGTARLHSGFTLLTLRNDEPHARIVAKRTGIERDAMAGLRAQVKTVGEAYVARLRKETGVNLGVGI